MYLIIAHDILLPTKDGMLYLGKICYITLKVCGFAVRHPKNAYLLVDTAKIW